MMRLTTDLDPEYSWLKKDMLENGGRIPSLKKHAKPGKSKASLSKMNHWGRTVGAAFILIGAVWLVSILGFSITLSSLLAIGLVAIGGFFIASPLTSNEERTEA